VLCGFLDREQRRRVSRATGEERNGIIQDTGERNISVCIEVIWLTRFSAAEEDEARDHQNHKELRT